jgi:hypothetical protein
MHLAARLLRGTGRGSVTAVVCDLYRLKCDAPIPDSHLGKRLAQRAPDFEGRTDPTIQKIGRRTPKVTNQSFPFKAR